MKGELSKYAKLLDVWDVLVALSLFWLFYAAVDYGGWKWALTAFSFVILVIAVIRAAVSLRHSNGSQ